MGRAAQDRKEGTFEGHLGVSWLKGQGSRKANFREEIEAESRNCLRSPNQEVGWSRIQIQLPPHSWAEQEGPTSQGAPSSQRP